MADDVSLREHMEQRWMDHVALHALHDESHRREHEQTQTALDKAEKQTGNALDKAEHTVSLRFDAGSKASDLMRDQIIALQKSDVGKEQRSLGQAAAVGAIIAGLAAAGAIIGIIVNLGRLT